MVQCNLRCAGLLPCCVVPCFCTACTSLPVPFSAACAAVYTPFNVLMVFVPRSTRLSLLSLFSSSFNQGGDYKVQQSHLLCNTANMHTGNTCTHNLQAAPRVCAACRQTCCGHQVQTACANHSEHQTIAQLQHAAVLYCLAHVWKHRQCNTDQLKRWRWRRLARDACSQSPRACR